MYVQLLRAFSMLQDSELLAASTVGSLDVLACDLIRSVARLSPSAPPTAVQMAAGVLELALILSGRADVVETVLGCLLDTTLVWITGSSALATLGTTQVRFRRSPTVSHCVSAKLLAFSFHVCHHHLIPVPCCSPLARKAGKRPASARIPLELHSTRGSKNS